MRTAKQWFDEMKLRPCVTENDLVVMIGLIQSDALKSESVSHPIIRHLEHLAGWPCISQVDCKDTGIPVNEYCHGCYAKHALTHAKSIIHKQRHDFLDQPLNEGDGTYKP